MKASGTMTSDGFIPYFFDQKRCRLLPVKINQPISETGICLEPDKIHPPKRTRLGHLVFALPGGGEMSVADSEITEILVFRQKGGSRHV